MALADSLYPAEDRFRVALLLAEIEMDEDQAPDQASLFPKSVGDRLREAREARGLALADIANATRVPIRHLEAIEQGRFDGLSPTYAIGFAKSYARAVGLDDKSIAGELRANPQMPLSPSANFEEYEPTDPRRVPTRGVATVAALIAVALLAVVAIWYGSGLFHGSTGESPAPVASETVAAAPEATPTPVSGGQVTLTATDSVWLRIYDAKGTTLFEKTLQPGERYDVPGNADNPMINIGRPDKLQVTINGSAVAPLGDGRVAIKDIPISASALQARGTPAATVPAPAATPAASAPAPAPARTPAASKTNSVPPAFRDPAPRPTTPAPRPTPAAEPTASPPAGVATPAP